jgi:AbrB family looped-hinge helix DNA binding protein
MRITSKGQVTIPVEIREQLGLTPNTEVEFEVISRRSLFKKTKAKLNPGKTLIEMMRGQRVRLNIFARVAYISGLKTLSFTLTGCSCKATVKMTTDEIMVLTRQD